MDDILEEFVAVDETSRKSLAGTRKTSLISLSNLEKFASQFSVSEHIPTTSTPLSLFKEADAATHKNESYAGIKTHVKMLLTLISFSFIQNSRKCKRNQIICQQ